MKSTFGLLLGVSAICTLTISPIALVATGLSYVGMRVSHH